MSINLFCLLFMEFISLNVTTLRFLRNFHTVLPRNRTSLHSLQPCRRFPDLQASSAFIISGLFANCYSDWHEVMHHCSFVCISYSFALVRIFHLPLASKRASCPTQAQQLWQLPQSMWRIPGPGIQPMAPALSDGLSTTGWPVCLAFFPFEMHIYFSLAYNCFTMLC